MNKKGDVAVFLTEKEIKNKICKKGSLPESADILSHQAGACRCQETPPCPWLEGSFTLEAAVILPVLTLFFVMILMFFRIMQVQMEVQKALDDTGRRLAVLAVEESADDSVVIGIAAANVLLKKNLKKNDNINRYVVDKAAGISLLSSKFTGDEIYLMASYRIKIPVWLPGKSQLKIRQHTVCRKWTGWTENGSDAEIWVYVTEKGSVYHTLRECTYLKLSVTSVNYEGMEKRRNKYGEKYHECEICAEKSKVGDTVFITDQGNRFHYDLNCSGIKRTIYMVRLSEVGNRKKCSRCEN